MVERPFTQGSDHLGRPRDLFRILEAQAIATRKLLKRLECHPDPKSIDDAVALTELIEQLARRGSAAPAAEAIDLADVVEFLNDTLSAKVEALLAS